MKTSPSLIHPNATLNAAMLALINKKDGDPPVTIGSSVHKTPLNDVADGRDILSLFVGAGHTSMGGNKDLQNHFNRLSQIVGAPLAQKLTSQAFLFNQRPDVQRLSPEQRVQNFYDLGSNDNEVSGYLSKLRTLGTGQLTSFRTSPLIGNSILQGKNVGTNTGDSNMSGKIGALMSKHIK